MRPDHVELTCWGPVEVAVARAAEHGVRVVGWTHREGGLVTLFADRDSEDAVLRWYGSETSATWPQSYPGRLCAVRL